MALRHKFINGRKLVTKTRILFNFDYSHFVFHIITSQKVKYKLCESTGKLVVFPHLEITEDLT